jgi:hypothetical protein
MWRIERDSFMPTVACVFGRGGNKKIAHFNFQGLSYIFTFEPYQQLFLLHAHINILSQSKESFSQYY